MKSACIRHLEIHTSHEEKIKHKYKVRPCDSQIPAKSASVFDDDNPHSTCAHRNYSEKGLTSDTLREFLTMSFQELWLPDWCESMVVQANHGSVTLSDPEPQI